MSAAVPAAPAPPNQKTDRFVCVMAGAFTGLTPHKLLDKGTVPHLLVRKLPFPGGPDPYPADKPVRLTPEVLCGTVDEICDHLTGQIRRAVAALVTTKDDWAAHHEFQAYLRESGVNAFAVAPGRHAAALTSYFGSDEVGELEAARTARETAAGKPPCPLSHVDRAFVEDACHLVGVNRIGAAAPDGTPPAAVLAEMFRRYADWSDK